MDLLVSIGLEFYSALLSSSIICYMICRINSDLKKASMINYVISSLSIASVITFVNVTIPDLNMGMELLAFSITILFVVIPLYKYNMYYTTISVFFSVLLLSLGDLLVSLVYADLMKLNPNEFRSSFVHATIGKLMSFLFSYIVLNFLADDFIKVRKRIYKNHKKLLILLCGNLITVFVILLFLISLHSFTFELKDVVIQNNILYISVIIIVGVLLASIAGTLYLINYFLLNRIKYDRLKMDNLKDVMTGTLNRGSGLKFIEDQLGQCKKQKKSMTICYFDVNDLKVINDMLGHREGDFLIKTIIATIKKNIRETDVISRLGGDEFVIVFPGCTMDYSEGVMERISGELRQLKPFVNKDYNISISYGFSQYNGERDITVEGLLDKADHQMYQNKRAIKAMA